eukprot:2472725-Prorocentrum_lima.AAC.1
MFWTVRGSPLQPQEYQTCSEYGELQEEYLTALNCTDMLAENLRFYNVRRAKTGQTTTGHGNCGLAFPAKMWDITAGWKFYCS